MELLRNAETSSSSSANQGDESNANSSTSLTANLPTQTSTTNSANSVNSATSSSATTTTTNTNITTSSNSSNNPTGPKNIKNMSIKEFFTTRLMKGKSFDVSNVGGGSGGGGGGHSPKDETTNWFDEFKARMIKKSQKSSNSLSSTSNNLITEENQSEESNDSGDNAGRQKRNSKSKLKSKLKMALGDGGSSSSSKYGPKFEQCDNGNLSVLTESFEDLTEFSSPAPSRDSIPSFKLSSQLSSLRSRRLQRISRTDKPDFDTSSINTIVGRRDSRYATFSSTTSNILFNRLTIYFYAILKWVVSNMLPFNYTLPWKLISAVMFSLVILVIGFASSANPENGIFSFVNGFFCGIAIATLCFIITFLSLIVKILPGSRDKSVVNRLTSTNANQPADHRPTLNPNQRATSSLKMDVSHNKSSPPTATTTTTTSGINTAEDRSSNSNQSTRQEVENPDATNTLEQDTHSRTDSTSLDDESYKGWMIEFVGDYELRNRGEVKLKLLYVRFENRVLYLYKVKSNQDVESSSFPANVQQRVYDLKTVRNLSANLLFPKNVRNLKKWLWSKKYPIKIEFIQKINNTNTNQADSTYSDSPSKKATPDYKPVQLTLFTKTCREKEEWFRRFKRLVEEIRLAQVTENPYKFAMPQVPTLMTTTTTDTDATSLPPFLSDSNRSSKRESSNKQEQQQQNMDGSRNNLKPTEHDIATASNDLSKANQNLNRTKSCELLHHQKDSKESDSLSQDLPDYWTQTDTVGHRNDSTLTPANVDIYSQAVGDLNFIETRPNLDYKEYIERVIGSSSKATKTSDWFNSLTGRIFFDVFSQNYWSYWFKRKIQRKLHRIRLPYFMDTLTLTNIDLGSNAPQFLNVVSHQFDSFGLSIDYDVSYEGGLTMTFETKLNLLKMKPDNQTTTGADGQPNSTGGSTQQATSSTSQQQNDQSSATSTTKETGSGSDSSSTHGDYVNCSPIDSADTGLNATGSKNLKSCSSSSTFASSSTISGVLIPGTSEPGVKTNDERASLGTTSDSSGSESESSSDSSSDEADIDEISDWEDYGAEKTRQNLVRLVDKIASSRYFQQATENRYIKKKLLDISNCPLILVVKIESLTGVLTFNIPPPQTDRVWYGFRPNPELVLKAMPRMGDREVSLSHVTDWIERKLEEEFRKILVIPNMEDVVLPVLKSDHLLYVTPTK